MEEYLNLIFICLIIVNCYLIDSVVNKLICNCKTMPIFTGGTILYNDFRIRSCLTYPISSLSLDRT